MDRLARLEENISRTEKRNKKKKFKRLLLALSIYSGIIFIYYTVNTETIDPGTLLFVLLCSIVGGVIWFVISLLAFMPAITGSREDAIELDRLKQLYYEEQKKTKVGDHICYSSGSEQPGGYNIYGKDVKKKTAEE